MNDPRFERIAERVHEVLKDFGAPILGAHVLARAQQTLDRAFAEKLVQRPSAPYACALLALGAEHPGGEARDIKVVRAWRQEKRSCKSEAEDGDQGKRGARMAKHGPSSITHSAGSVLKLG